MITLEQIQKLVGQFKKAVEIIDQLKRENGALRGKLGEYEKRISELEILIARFKDDQREIEEKILHALAQLDHIEYEIAEKEKTSPEKKIEEPAPKPAEPEEKAPVLEATPPETLLDSDIPDEEKPKGKDSVELDIF